MKTEKNGFKKNDIVTVTITDMDEKGQGIGKADGFTLFVKDAVVGDVVETKVMKAKTNYAFAKLVKPLAFRRSSIRSSFSHVKV